MILRTQSGSALVTGLLLLSLVSLLALAGAAAAHVNLQLARNEQFRQNAASAASVGIESAIRRIVSSPLASSAHDVEGSLPELHGAFQAHTRLLGYESGLPQIPGGNLAGAHYEIIATGSSLRGALDRQRAVVRVIVTAPGPVEAGDCEPLAPTACAVTGELRLVSWHRMPAE